MNARFKTLRRLSYCEVCKFGYDPMLQRHEHPHAPLDPDATKRQLDKMRQAAKRRP